MRIVLVPPPGDTTLLADEPGGGRVPVHRWLEPLPAGLVVTDRLPCSECPRARNEDWNPRMRDAAGVCAISRVVCARADEPGAQGEVTGMLLVDKGEPVLMAVDRAARALGARTLTRVNTTGTGVLRLFSPQPKYRVPRAPGCWDPWGILDLCDAWEAEGARVVVGDGTL